jgi:hypothetical protein
MRTDFTQEDEGKPVHDDVYEHIGKIVKVEDGTGYIDLDPSVGEEVKSALGFSNPREDVYPIHDEMVQSTAGEVVRLRGDL